MKKYINEVARMVEAKFSAGKPNEIRAELRRLRRKHNPTKADLANAEKILKLQSKKVEDPFFAKFTRDFTLGEIEAINDKFDESIVKAVRKSMSMTDGTSFAIEAVERAGSVLNYRIDTVVSTVKAGLTRALTFAEAKASGIKYFRYDGPVVSAREFCADRLGKIYSIEEIEAMEGQKGLPPKYFCGGYNCRHRWIPVDIETALRERAGYNL